MASEVRTFLALVEYGWTWVIIALLVRVRELLPTTLMDAFLSHLLDAVLLLREREFREGSKIRTTLISADVMCRTDKPRMLVVG